MLNKNDIVNLTIEGMTHNGSGVGKINGFAVFVPFTAVGDEIKARILKVNKNYAFGKIEEIITPSESRIEPDCETNVRCGGCTYRHISYEEELRVKRERVKDAFKKIGGMDITVLPVIPCENITGYRNKAQFPVKTGENGEVDIGFFALRSHEIINVDNCAIQSPVFAEIVRVFRQWIKENDISIYNEQTGNGLLRHIYLRQGFYTGQIMVCAVINGYNLPHSQSLIDLLTKAEPNIKSIVLNINKKSTNVILGDSCKAIWGSDKIEDNLNGIRFLISPLSFYQVNPAQTVKLYEKAIELAGLDGTQTVLDLYCGIGTISLFMAGKAKEVYGVEIVEEAVKDAQENTKLNGITNAQFFTGDAFKAAAVLAEKGIRPQVLVLDPPRKGIEPQLIDLIAEMSPEKIVYVSCDSETLARDVRLFSEKGYKTNTAFPVDMFPRTPHVECVVLMSRVKECVCEKPIK